MKIATFKVDVSSEVGQRLCGGLLPDAHGVRDPLYARGMILDDGRQRAVLCAVDYCEIGGRFHQEWRHLLVRAAQTSPDRVALHTVHQHDAPLLREGMADAGAATGLELWHEDWWKKISQRLEQGVRAAADSFQSVSFVGRGLTRLSRLASNRRILDENGKASLVRWSVSSAELRRHPVGVIDPYLRTVTFWSGSNLLTSLHCYACHPQSSSGRGLISADVPGEALRLLEDKYPHGEHLYFTGCAGDITFGKYATSNREKNLKMLGKRLFEGMSRGISSSGDALVAASEFEWRSIPIKVPWKVRDCATARKILRDASLPVAIRASGALIVGAQHDKRLFAEQKVSLLKIGPVCFLFLPCEPFLAYQFFVQGLRPDLFVSTIGLGDGTIGYIPLAESFPQGGYEVTPAACFTSPQVEKHLKSALRTIMQDAAESNSRP